MPREQPEDKEAVYRRFGTFGGSLVLHLLFLLILWFIVLPGGSVNKILTIFAPNVVEDDRVGRGDGPGEGYEDGVPDLEVPDAPLGNIHGPELFDTGPPLRMDFGDGAPTVPASMISATGTPMAINIGSDFGGRSTGARGVLARAGGGSPESEEAVDRGLDWLKRHQDTDGGWSFDHHINDKCDCEQPGTVADCRTGATAMALLAFLGAGHTPERGKYHREVRDGVQFLIRCMEINEHGADLQGEAGYRSMYVQGLAAIALCEAHAMSQPFATAPAEDSDLSKKNKESSKEVPQADKSKAEKRKAVIRRNAALRKATKSRPVKRGRANRVIPLEEAAQASIDYIMAAQDPEGGGWRYEPRMRGDTSVVGWQVMALQSARAGQLVTQRVTFEKASYFLDSVAADGNSQYGYMSPEIGQPCTTAIALLCRMYMGWNRDNPGLRKGVEILSEAGPDFGDMYYNYYATQVMHHWGGEAWKQWNSVMRDHLIDTQLREGHASGSWDVADYHGTQGGRLYMTCLCIMTLEVYYRHLPLYQRETLEQVLTGKKSAE